MFRLSTNLFSRFRERTTQPLHLQLILFGIFVLLTALPSVEAAHNTTVDDYNSRIVYSPASAWKSFKNHTDRISNTSHYTSTQNAYAEFSFTGAVNVYYVGYGISEDNNTRMSVIFDGNTYIVDQKRAKDKRAKAYLWSSGVINAATTHTIKCLKTTKSGADNVNIDAFILTIPDAADTTTTTSTTPSSTSTEEPTSTTSESSTTTSNTTSVLPVWSPVRGGIAETTSSTPTSSPSSSASPNPPPAVSTTNIALIVGSSLGGVAIIIIIIAVYIYFGRLKEHRNRNDYRNWYRNRYFKEKPNEGTAGGFAGGNHSEVYPMTEPQAPFAIPRPSTAASGQASLSSISFETQLHPYRVSHSPYQPQMYPSPSQSPQVQVQSLQPMQQQTQLLSLPNQSRQSDPFSHSRSNSQSQHSHSESAPTPMSSRVGLSEGTSDIGDISEIGDDPHDPIAPQPPPYSPRGSSQPALPVPLPMTSNSTLPESPLPTSTLHYSTLQTMLLTPQTSTPSARQQFPQ